MKVSKIMPLFLAGALACMAKPVIKITLDRADHAYKCGEKAVFTVNVTDDGGKEVDQTAFVRVSNDGQKVLMTRNVDLKKENSFKVEQGMDVPGFVRLFVSLPYKAPDAEKPESISAQAGAAFEPLKIMTGVEKPADFMDFWKSEVKKAEAIPLDVQMEKLDAYSNDKYTGYKVSFAAPGGRVYGFLNIPAKPGKHPAVVSVPGAGPGTSRPSSHEAMVTLHMNVHAYDPLTPGKTIKELYAEANKPTIYMYNSGAGKDSTFFHRAILGINRAVNWLAERPEVDAARMGYYGSSQGGAFGFILGGLNGKFAALVCNVPAMCDQFGYKKDRLSGWPQFCKAFSYSAEIQETAKYYDAAFFASHIKAPIRVIVGFIDSTCSPSSVYAAYNSIPSTDKAIVNEYYMGHSCWKSYNEAQAWMKKQITK